MGPRLRGDDKKRKIGGHMKTSHRVLLTALVLVSATASANAQQPSLDRRVGDIVQAGKIRIGLHLPQFVKDPANVQVTLVPAGQGKNKPKRVSISVGDIYVEVVNPKH